MVVVKSRGIGIQNTTKHNKKQARAVVTRAYLLIYLLLIPLREEHFQHLVVMRFAHGIANEEEHEAEENAEDDLM